jgi:hypothetical protein
MASIFFLLIALDDSGQVFKFESIFLTTAGIVICFQSFITILNQISFYSKCAQIWKRKKESLRYCFPSAKSEMIQIWIRLSE